MYDRNKIITGVIIFLIVLAFPMIYLAATGDSGYVPVPEIIGEEEQCVESAEYMRENHMKLLQDWRESVVRGADRTYVARDGKEYDVSLVNTCLECHPNKAEFCDQCHEYIDAQPSCWDCHEVPAPTPAIGGINGSQ